MPSNQSKISIKIERNPRELGTNNVTKFVQVKNTSRKDQMSAVDFVYEDSSGSKKRLPMTDQLQPQKVIKIDFAKAGLPVQVVSFQFVWQFEGNGFGSQLHVAKPGSYFYSMDAGLKPDGSSESDWLVEKPIRLG